jgi:hypothetical protein
VAESGLTATSARDLLRVAPLERAAAGEPASIALLSAVEGLDGEVLAKVGIDHKRVRAVLEQESVTGAAAVPAGVRKTIHHLAGAAALRLGQTRVTSDHALLGVLNARAVEKFVLTPLGINPSDLSSQIEAALRSA